MLLSHKKVENFTLCDSKDGSGEHYGKWNKPVRGRQIPYVKPSEQTELVSKIDTDS